MALFFCGHSWLQAASPVTLLYPLATFAVYSILEKWGVACPNPYISPAASRGLLSTPGTLWNV